MRRYPLVKTRYGKWRAYFGEVAAPARADAVLTDAALSGNRAIADAAGALTGAAPDTHYEVEIFAALVDHEVGITANAGMITAETALRVAADAALDGRIGAEESARIAAPRKSRSDNVNRYSDKPTSGTLG